MTDSPDSDDSPLRLDRIALGTESAVAALISLDRPATLNTIDEETIVALDAVLDAIEADASIRCILVTGEGRAFSAGGDLKKYIELQINKLSENLVNKRMAMELLENTL